MNEHLVRVYVTRVDEPSSMTVTHGIGHESTTGDVVEFVGDWRPMAQLREALEDADEHAARIFVDLERWQIVGRYPNGRHT